MTNPLPTSGPLGKRDDYNPTNRDLYDNALRQNKTINEVHSVVGEVRGEVMTLKDTVKNHGEVIDAIVQIKTIALWILAFVGLGGLASAANWIKLWVQTK